MPHRTGLRFDEPAPSGPAQSHWGSDAIAAALAALPVPYLAMNPGASYRGLHDSLVNRLGNAGPRLLLCLHEEHAVALAHGYAKVTGRPLGVLLHANVGLMHATMAIFNAWCDRVPMLVVGATGPWDAAARRPWIDWIHTASDQGALVRGYTKWDNQPASVAASVEALLRAWQIAATPPCGPTYVNLDAAVQEAALAQMPPLPDVARFAPPALAAPEATALARAVQLLSGASRPLLLIGRVGRSPEAWAERVALAEALNARVLTDLKLGAAFPTDHALHAAAPAHLLVPAACDALRAADVVLALDWVDLGGTLKQACGSDAVAARIVNVSPDVALHRGWSHDYQALAPADVYLACTPEAVVPQLLAALPARTREATGPTVAAAEVTRGADSGAITLTTLARAFDAATAGTDICLTRLPLAWDGAQRHFRHPLDYIGLEGGGGVGAGPGITVGAALALAGSGRTAVALLGDGDFLMGHTALWTAAHHGIACLLIVVNNQSFYNDEIHQQRVARTRGRPEANKWIGQRIADPDIDLAALARAQGAVGIGPVADAAGLPRALADGLAQVRAGAVCVIDVRIQMDLP